MFRFTIRDMLWLTVVVALGAGWWVDHRILAGSDKERLEALLSQEVHLQMVEISLLDTPPDKLDIELLRTWARERREHRDRRNRL